MKMASELDTDNQTESTLGFRTFWESVLEDINNDVLLAGKPADTILFLNRIRKFMIISAFIIFPLSLVLFFYLSPLFLGINLIWITMVAFPKLQQSSLSQERKKKVEQEIPTFVIFASVMQSVGVGLYESFQLFRENRLFDAMNKEAMLMKRNVEYFGLSQMEALEELGRTHTSEMFKNLLLGYTSIWRSGGDLSLYLENRAEEFFVTLKERYQTYTGNVGTLTEVLVTLLIILPMMIMVVSFVLPGTSLEHITLLAIVGLPIFAIIMSIIFTSIQPRNFNLVGLNQNALIALVGLGIASGIGAFFAFEKVWIAILVGFLVPAAISAIITGRHQHEIKKLEGSLPQFLRDITEYKKIGYDILLALIKLSRENTYSSSFSKKLNRMAVHIANGTSPTASVKTEEFRSHFTKISFYLIAYITEFGGGNPRTLETITRFVTNAKQVVKEGTSSVSALTIIIFASPVIMVFTAGMIMGILDSIEESSFEVVGDDLVGSSTGGLSANFINLVTVTEGFLSMIKTLIVISSLLGAILITKAIDFTFFNTWRVVVIGLITLGSVLLLDNPQNFEFDFDFAENLSFN